MGLISRVSSRTYSFRMLKLRKLCYCSAKTVLSKNPIRQNLSTTSKNLQSTDTESLCDSTVTEPLITQVQTLAEAGLGFRGRTGISQWVPTAPFETILEILADSNISWLTGIPCIALCTRLIFLRQKIKTDKILTQEVHRNKIILMEIRERQ